MPNDRRQITLGQLKLIIGKHFNPEIAEWFYKFYYNVGQQQLEIMNFFKQQKINNYTADILMLSLTVDVLDIPIFVKATGLFVKTAPISKLLLDTISERPKQTKMPI